MRTTDKVVALGSRFDHQGAIPMHRFLEIRFEEPSLTVLSFSSPTCAPLIKHRSCMRTRQRQQKGSVQGDEGRVVENHVVGRGKKTTASPVADLRKDGTRRNRRAFNPATTVS